jgi:hypothetical protein
MLRLNNCNVLVSLEIIAVERNKRGNAVHRHGRNEPGVMNGNS